MAIHRGIQSAIFYYLSCAPCAEARYKKQRKKEAARGRVERKLLQAEIPNLYEQPSPSSTNPHWQTEIALGPTLPTRRKRKPTPEDRSQPYGTDDVLTYNPSPEPGSLDLASNHPVQDRWNFRVYQREDEELWGSNTSAGASAGHQPALLPPQRALTRNPKSPSVQYYRNPPINDMHPATVTKIHSRDEVMWMLQPPPVAEVMQGKERVTRGCGGGGTGRNPASCDNPPSKPPSNRAVQHQVKADENTASFLSRGPSMQPAPSPKHDKMDLTSAHDSAASLALVDKSKPSKLLQLSSTATSETPSFPTDQPPKKKLPHFTRHETAPSAQISDGLRALYESTIENEHREEPRTDDSESEQVLKKPSTFIVTGDITPTSIRGKVFRARNEILQRRSLVTTTQTHDVSEDLLRSLRPELFDSWYTSNFELGKWIHETTKREVKQRWSMDL